MSHRPGASRRPRSMVALAVLGAGWLTTVATSPAENPSARGRVDFELEPGEARHVEIVVSETAVEHVRVHEASNILAGFDIYVSGDAIEIIPDDETVAPLPGYNLFESGASDCPETGECRFG